MQYNISNIQINSRGFGINKFRVLCQVWTSFTNFSRCRPNECNRHVVSYCVMVFFHV